MSPAPPSFTATASTISVHGGASKAPSLFASRSTFAAPENPETSSSVIVPFSRAFAARSVNQIPSASVVPTATTSSTVPAETPASPSISRIVSAERSVLGAPTTSTNSTSVPAVLAENSLITGSATPSGVREKSSTASPSSDEATLTSSHRIQTAAPLGTERSLTVALMAVRLASALPSSCPTVGP